MSFILPKGSHYNIDDIHHGVLTRDVKQGDKFVPDMFEPTLPLGIKFKLLIISYKGMVIYQHPYFFGIPEMPRRKEFIEPCDGSNHPPYTPPNKSDVDEAIDLWKQIRINEGEQVIPYKMPKLHLL